jgi:hypothetical protein
LKQLESIGGARFEMVSQYVDLKIAIFLAACTIALFLMIPMVANAYGARVADRFLERSFNYDEREVTDWVKANRRAAAGYAFPVLFPFDLVFMFCLGGFLAVASTTILSHGGAPPWGVVASLILPVVYVAFDLAEDSVLARMLTSPDSIAGLICYAKPLTLGKFATCGLAITQTAGVAIWALLFSR